MSTGSIRAPPASHADASHLAEIYVITPAIEATAGGAASHLSRGGMTTKVDAGKIATQAGTAMIIAKGIDSHPLYALANRVRHTLFHPAQSRAQARKRWIMGTLAVSSALQVDAGAARALQIGKSLLLGVTRVTGEFGRGDAVDVLNPDGNEIARGLTGLDSEEARLVMDKRSDGVLELLSAGNRAALIHSNNLVLVGTKEDSHEPS